MRQNTMFSSTLPSSIVASLLTSLTAYWNFDEAAGTFVDEVAGYVATGSGTTYDAAGILSRCVGYDTSTDDLTVPNGAWVNTGNAYSISIWVKFNNLSTTLGRSQTLLRTFYSVTSLDTVLLWAPSDGNYISLSTRNSTPTQFTTDTNNGLFSTGVWYHIVAVQTGDGVTAGKMYVNGSNKTGSATTFTGTLTPPDGTLRIGCSTTASTSAIDGFIDELGLWDRALTDADVSTLWNAGLGRTYPFS